MKEDEPKQRELVCPLFEICNDKWKWYTKIKCRMIELIENGEVSERAVEHIRHEVFEFLESKGIGI